MSTILSQTEMLGRGGQFPALVLVTSFLVLWLSTKIGVTLRTPSTGADPRAAQDLGLIVSATLTLLGIMIGFGFSMAITRYDQRKHYEEEEANAIGTEYLRADILREPDAARLKGLLVRYLDRRIHFYNTGDADSSKLEGELWSAARVPAASDPTPVMALAVSGLNDLINASGYTQAAWWNQIPAAAWTLMGVIAVSAHLLAGYAMQSPKVARLMLVLPLLTAISFFLIADIDSPKGGAIRVSPHNLISLAESLRTPQ